MTDETPQAPAESLGDDYVPLTPPAAPERQQQPDPAPEPAGADPAREPVSDTRATKVGGARDQRPA